LFGGNNIVPLSVSKRYPMLEPRSTAIRPPTFADAGGFINRGRRNWPTRRPRKLADDGRSPDNIFKYTFTFQVLSAERQSTDD
jgi:outer membrane protein assembly factor BamA